MTNIEADGVPSPTKVNSDYDDSSCCFLFSCMQSDDYNHQLSPAGLYLHNEEAKLALLQF